MSLPLALHLRSAVVAELIRQGATVLAPGPDLQDCVHLRGSWLREKKDLSLNLEAFRMGEKGIEVIGASSGRIPSADIDPKDLLTDRESWARYLLRRLEAGHGSARSLSIHVRPLMTSGSQLDPELGRYLVEWLYAALVESSTLRPLDQQTAMRGIPISELRTRGIAPKAKSTETTSLTGDLLKTDGELRGEVWAQSDKETLELRLRVVDRAGRQLADASVDIPRAYFPPELLKPVTAPEASPQEGLSRKRLVAEISTTRGETRPLYRKGERIAFLVRVNRPSYLYLFNLDSAGNATLLYSVDAGGRPSLSGACGRLLDADVPLVIPEDGCSVDLIVQEPFGTDTVWAIATEGPLPLPANLSGEWTRTESLVARIRQLALAGEGGYAECKLRVITRP